MAIVHTCDRCGFKSLNPGEVVRYVVSMTSDRPPPIQSCEVDLCKTCTETAWRGIREHLFRIDRPPS
jgi:hypothetical protein